MNPREKYAYTLLAIAFFCAIFLFFWGTWNEGLHHWDEHYFTTTAKRLLGIRGSNIQPWDPLVFPFFLALSFYLFGVHDYVAIGTSAAFGVLTVILTYVLGSKTFGRRVGAIGALLLSVMEYYVIFARMALADVAFTFFFTMSLIAYFVSLQRKRMIFFAVAGLVTAVCIGTKYNGFQPLVIAALYLVIWKSPFRDIVSILRTPRLEFRERVKRLWVSSIELGGLVVSGLVLASLSVAALAYLGSALQYNTLYVSPYLLARSFPHNLGIGYKYFQDIILANKAPYLRPVPFNAFYLRVLLSWVSPLVLVLFGVGVIHSVRKRENGGLFLATSAVSLFAYFSFANYSLSRVILPILPSLALLAARGLFALPTICTPILGKLKIHTSGTRLASVLLLLVVVSSMYTSVGRVNLRYDAYRLAGQYLSRNLSSGGIVWVESQPAVLFYLAPQTFSLEKQDILTARFVLIDFTAAARGHLPEIMEVVRSRGMILVAEFRNPTDEVALFDWYSFDQVMRMKNSPDYTAIRIYGMPDDAVAR